MEPPHFTIDRACREIGLRSAAIALRDLYIGPSSAALRAEIDEAAEEVRRQFSSPAEIRGLPEVQAFRELLRRAGVNPRKHSPTVEKLLQMALKQGTLPAVNSLADAYNLASLRTRCSLGAHDAEALAWPICLGELDGSETFAPLGGGDQPLAAGQFGYRDARQRLLCWLDLRQAEFSKITESTTRAVLIVERVAPSAEPAAAGRLALQEACDAACATLLRHCGGAVEWIECSQS